MNAWQSQVERGPRLQWSGTRDGILLCVVAGLLLLSACPDPAAPCTRTSDCQDDAICVEAQCRRVCNASEDCDADQRCVQGACMPVAVAADASTPRDAAASDARPGDGSGSDRTLSDVVGADRTIPDAARDAARSDSGRDASLRVDAAAADLLSMVDGAMADGAVSDLGSTLVDSAAAYDGKNDDGTATSLDVPIPSDAATDASAATDATSPDVTVSLCGNWQIDSDEGCDDGDRYDSDGCSSLCQVETGWHCGGEPSRCCPDGYQDNDLDGSCEPTCATAGLAGCSGHGTCSDLGGTAICSCAHFFEGTSCDACVVRVKLGRTGDGSSWDLALPSVQAGVDKASTLAGVPSICQVRVATGTFQVLQPIVMSAGLAVIGGYAGEGATPDLQDSEATPSVLDGMGQVRHIIEAKSNNLFMGLTLRKGRASQSSGPNSQGAGLYLAPGAQSVIIQRCIFVDNEARSWGGALSLESADAKVVDSVFVANFTTRSEETYGGGAINVFQSTLLLQDSVVTGNTSAGAGGALRAEDSTVVIERCVLAGNSAGFTGGALRVQGTSSVLTLIGSVLVGNLASGPGALAGNGGGLRLFEGRATISGCTLVHNQAYGEAGLSFGTPATAMQVRNCVAWANVPPVEQVDSIGPDVAFSNVENWTSGGAGMKSEDPQFGIPLVGTWTADAVTDLDRARSLLTDGGASWIPGRLAGRLVRVNTSSGIAEYLVVDNSATELLVQGVLQGVPLHGKDYAISDYRPQSTSPCIDSADTLFLEPDLLGHARVCPDGLPGCPDMGCYEFTP
ncbi:MAG: hypothetical protein ABIJ09_18545 [Pseudomonadota bacterium]